MTQRYRFKVDKLIRDKLPDIMRKDGIFAFARVMETDEYVKRLKDKLLEEAKEVVEARNRSAIKEELADLLEVIHALSLAQGLSYQECEDARLKKKDKKGGFERCIYNAYVEMDSDNKSIGYYQARPDEYPEVK